MRASLNLGCDEGNRVRVFLIPCNYHGEAVAAIKVLA